MTDREVDEASLKTAAMMASSLGAPLHYWIVVETPDEMRSTLPLLRREGTLMREITPDVQESLKKGFAVDVCGGIPEGEYELVVLAFRGRRGLKKVFPRTECLSILHRAKVNYLILWGPRQRMRKILICTGGSIYGQQAVEYGARLASALKVPVTLLHVAETEPSLFLGRVKEVSELKEELKAALDKAMDTLNKAEVEAEQKVRYGKIAEQILSEASSGGHDMIVVGSHGVGGIRQFILGSVSTELVKRSRIPLLVVRVRESETLWRRLFRRRYATLRKG